MVFQTKLPKHVTPREWYHHSARKQMRQFGITILVPFSLPHRFATTVPFGNIT